MLGLIVGGFGLVIVFVWAPLDTATGLIERVRGRSAIGDAFAPTVAGALIIAAGLWLAVMPANRAALTRANLAWLGALCICVALGLTAMRWTGPALALVAEADYRVLRDTIPWKYVGYVLGGAWLAFGLMTLVERRVLWSRLLIALAVAAALALGCDLAFEDLLLPPNGDV